MHCFPCLFFIQAFPDTLSLSFSFSLLLYLSAKSCPSFLPSFYLNFSSPLLHASAFLFFPFFRILLHCLIPLFHHIFPLLPPLFPLPVHVFFSFLCIQRWAKFLRTSTFLSLPYTFRSQLLTFLHAFPYSSEAYIFLAPSTSFLPCLSAFSSPLLIHTLLSSCLPSLTDSFFSLLVSSTWLASTVVKRTPAILVGACVAVWSPAQTTQKYHWPEVVHCPFAPSLINDL